MFIPASNLCIYIPTVAFHGHSRPSRLNLFKGFFLLFSRRLASWTFPESLQDVQSAANVIQRKYGREEKRTKTTRRLAKET